MNGSEVFASKTSSVTATMCEGNGNEEGRGEQVGAGSDENERSERKTTREEKVGPCEDEGVIRSGPFGRSHSGEGDRLVLVFGFWSPVSFLYLVGVQTVHFSHSINYLFGVICPLFPSSIHLY